MPTGAVVKKEEFEKIQDTNTKLNIVFDTTLETQRIVTEHMEDVKAITKSYESRFAKITTWKKLDTALAVMAGAVAGFFAGLFKV